MTAGRNSKRRRRVILDEAVQSTLGNPVSRDRKSSPDSTQAYSNAAKRRGQLKTTDLIPKRRWSVSIVLGTIVMVVLVINLLAFYSQNWTSLASAEIPPFGISGVGTISGWFSSLLLMITGMASLQIYGMRRHRCDDYSGHYRIWLFMAVLFMIASANCVVNFRAIFTSMALAIGFGGQNGFVVLLVVKFVALTTLVVRGILEVRASRAALSAVILVWFAYASAIITQLPAVKNELVQNDQVVIGNSILVGVVATFFAVVFYARFVYLHANNLIDIEPVDISTTVNAKENRLSGTSPNENVEETKGKSRLSKIAAAQSKKRNDNSDDQKTGSEILKLESAPNSKTDRKRLKKQKNQQRRAA